MAKSEFSNKLTYNYVKVRVLFKNIFVVRPIRVYQTTQVQECMQVFDTDGAKHISLPRQTFTFTMLQQHTLTLVLLYLILRWLAFFSSQMLKSLWRAFP